MDAKDAQKGAKDVEKMINVPLDLDTKAALEARAKDNGRQMCREAAAIIKRAVKDGRAGGK